MRIEAECLISERERSLLEEIQSAQAAVTIYAYGMETQDGEGTVAYAFAMHQEDRWVEVYQRLETLDDFEQLGSEEVYHCQRVEHYSRSRIDLSGSVAAQ